MKRYTRMDRITDLISALNEKRAREGKTAVSRQWTGAGHWLKIETRDGHYISGAIYTSSDGFIGFLEGLLYEEPGEQSDIELLREIVDDFETSGCEGYGTVSIEVINKARKLLDYGLLEVEEVTE